MLTLFYWLHILIWFWSLKTANNMFFEIKFGRLFFLKCALISQLKPNSTFKSPYWLCSFKLKNWGHTNQGAALFDYEYSVKKWPGGRSSLSTTEYRLIIFRKSPFQLFLIYGTWETSNNKFKKHSVTKIFSELSLLE